MRHGLSLMEVLLAVAILGGSIAAISQLVSIGYRSALDARARTNANIHVDTKMAEVAAGVLELESVSSQVIEDDPDWSYSVDIADADQIGLLVVTVTVEQNNVVNPIMLSVVRFMPDPDYDPYALENL